MNNWQPMNTAPRDGRIVELMCTYGVRPWYDLHRWVEDRQQPRWEGVNSGCFVTDERYLQWRPFEGDPAAYVDPTGGQQSRPEYWR